MKLFTYIIVYKYAILDTEAVMKIAKKNSMQENRMNIRAKESKLKNEEEGSYNLHSSPRRERG